jgi:hypothetical protein
MPPLPEILKQIDACLAVYRQLQERSKYDDLSDLPNREVTGLITTVFETIKRFAPRGSQYRESMDRLIEIHGVSSGTVLPHVIGVLDSLWAAYAKGFLTSVAELIHADIFSDFLEMAEYLLSEGYKDPAAVIVGSVLEEHLRQLANANGVAIDVGAEPKKADQLKLDQKSITAWLDLRNKAAHGRYGEYSPEHVRLFLMGVRHFIARVPA